MVQMGVAPWIFSPSDLLAKFVLAFPPPWDLMVPKKVLLPPGNTTVMTKMEVETAIQPLWASACL